MKGSEVGPRRPECLHGHGSTQAAPLPLRKGVHVRHPRAQGRAAQQRLQGGQPLPQGPECLQLGRVGPRRVRAQDVSEEETDVARQALFPLGHLPAQHLAAVQHRHVVKEESLHREAPKDGHLGIHSQYGILPVRGAQRAVEGRMVLVQRASVGLGEVHHLSSQPVTASLTALGPVEDQDGVLDARQVEDGMEPVRIRTLLLPFPLTDVAVERRVESSSAGVRRDAFHTELPEGRVSRKHALVSSQSSRSFLRRGGTDAPLLVR